MNPTYRRPTTRFLAVLAALAYGGAACGPDYERTEFSGIVADDFSAGGSAAISVQRLEVHEGMILKSHVVSWNDDNVQMKLTLAVDDPEMIEIAGVISERDFAFIGKKVGHTRVRFTADDKVVLIVDADVVPQPEAVK